ERDRAPQVLDEEGRGRQSNAPGRGRRLARPARALCRRSRTQSSMTEEGLMSEFIVHSMPGSPFGRTVLAALEEKGARYRLAPLTAGASKSPEHLARHRFGRIPVLEHDGFSLYETQAILRYLDRVL